MKTETAEKRCWKCKRIIIGDSKLGLCSTCFNECGSPVVAIGGMVVAGMIWKNKGEIANGAINVIRHIKI